MMRIIIILITLSLSISVFANDIATINTLKKDAATAFKSKDYSKAITNYTILIDSFKVSSPSISLNLAHSYYLIDSTSLAKTTYTTVTSTSSKPHVSIAFQQLGKLIVQESKIELTKASYANTTPEQISTLKASLSHFKNALKNNPLNQDARYNYEAISKWLKNMPEEKKEEQKEHEKEQEKKQEEKKKEEEKKEQQKKEEEEKKEQNKKDKENEQKKKDDKKEDNKKGEKDKKEEGNKKDDKKDKAGKEENDKKGEQKDKGQENKKDDKKNGEEDKKKQEQGEKGKEEEKKKQEQEQTKPGDKKGDNKEDEKGDKGKQDSPEEKKRKEAQKQAAQIDQRLKENNLSKDKAFQILNSFDQQEKKYLQQQKRSTNTNPKSDKPDW